MPRQALIPAHAPQGGWRVYLASMCSSGSDAIHTRDRTCPCSVFGAVAKFHFPQINTSQLAVPGSGDFHHEVPPLPGLNLVVPLDICGHLSVLSAVSKPVIPEPRNMVSQFRRHRNISGCVFTRAGLKS
ncbi:hypothetical protein FRC08_016381 [Ceratobasidium sp. 394]|nr:hypothetical protein FRC08_016381 [Ceratobasidium sp. 394]